MLNGMTAKDLLRGHLALHCPEDELNSWYDPLIIELDRDQSCLNVTFPHHFFGYWLAGTRQNFLETCLKSCLGEKVRVRYFSGHRPAEPAFSPTLSVAGGENQKNQKNSSKPFGETFSLENFIHNKKNFFPLSVAREITASLQYPKSIPIVYYGKSGSGKSHLLRAIANGFSALRGEYAVFYGNMSQLLEQRGHSFKAASHTAYCIDDLHNFADNIPLQKKFAVFIDACLGDKKPIVCSCSWSPLSHNSHRTLCPGLRSRLEPGLIMELKNPDIDVRMRFIQTRCQAHGIDIPKEHAMLLAQRYEHLRQLSGVILKMGAYQEFVQRTLDEQDIESLLKQSPDPAPLSPQDIINRVADHLDLTPGDLTGKTRRADLVFARQTAMYLCRKLLGAPYQTIGDILGGKDHSTVIHSIKKIEKNIIIHEDMHKMVTKLTKLCAQGND